MELAGSVVVVTGASSGIGEAVARAFAGRGASLVLAARRTELIDRLADELVADGAQAIAVTADVTVEEEAESIMAAAIERFGQIDVLVNNAGMMLLGPLAEAPTEEWRRMVDVNVMGVLYCTRAALPHMLERDSGHIVYMSSLAGRFIMKGLGVYALTKQGINAFSETLRQELAHTGIRITVLEPGTVSTELLDHTRPEILEGLAASGPRTYVPLSAETVADAVVYAVSLPDDVVVNELMVRPRGQAF